MRTISTCADGAGQDTVSSEVTEGLRAAGVEGSAQEFDRLVAAIDDKGTGADEGLATVRAAVRRK